MSGVERMPTSALEAAHALLARLAKGETLSEREQGQLDVLRSAIHGEVALPPDWLPSSCNVATFTAPEPGDENSPASTALEKPEDQFRAPFSGCPDQTPAEKTAAFPTAPSPTRKPA